MATAKSLREKEGQVNKALKLIMEDCGVSVFRDLNSYFGVIITNDTEKCNPSHKAVVFPGWTRTNGLVDV